MPVTLDYFKTHPLRVRKDQRDVLIKTVREAEKSSVHAKDIHPTAGAYIHYGGVELADMLVMTQPNLSQSELYDLSKLWFSSCGVTCKQLLFYVWQIIVKELRHGTSAKTDKAFKGVNVDPEILQAVHYVTSSGSDYMKKVDAIGHKPVGLWVDAVERHFRHGGWAGAYGGPKWADIALVFKQYIDGTTSAMLAADRAWTLVHNTGPIFNKGFYFKNHDGHLQKVLDAQASSSVFKLSDMVHGNYDHPVLTAFADFKAMAEAAIQQVQPDYKAGSTGGVNSDGTKPTSGAFASNEKAGIVKKNVGPLVFSTSAERIEE